MRLALPAVATRALVTLFAMLALLPAGGAMAQAKADLIDLEDEVMCVVCGRPLSTSGGVAADDQRDVIQGFIDQGLDKTQVKDRLVAEYGEDVLVKDRSPVAAAAPVLAALIGAGSIVLLLRRRRAGAVDHEHATERASGASGEPLPAPSASREDDARIDAELAERS